MQARQRFLVIILMAVALGAGVQGFRYPLSGFLIRQAWNSSLHSGGAAVYPFPWVSSHPVAELRFPGSDRPMIVMSGTSGAVLEYAPLWHEGSDQPGAAGISLIAGDARNQFGFIRTMDPGDSFDLRTADGVSRHYVVEELLVVGEGPVNVGRGHSGDESVVILSTEYPYRTVSPQPGGEDAMRLVAVARETRTDGRVRYAGLP